MHDIFGIDIPFARYCGITAVWQEPGHTKLTVDLTDELTNSLGMAHGGVILTLLDIALATAARTLTGGTVITIDLQTAFLSPGRGHLIGEGRVVRPGRSLIYCEGEVRDSAGELVAKASGLFKAAKTPTLQASDTNQIVAR